jgi:hypothetical protein
MNAAPFTPGPWIFNAENDGGIYGHNMRTYVGGAVRLGTDEGNANAQLIAAAPDFYVACAAWLDDQTNDAEFAEKLRAIMREINKSL